MYIKLPKDKNIAKMESTTIKRVFTITNLFLQTELSKEENSECSWTYLKMQI